MNKLLTVEQCKSLNTKRLLSYYKSIRVDTLGCHYSNNGICGCQTPEEQKYIEVLQNLRKEIKLILSQREHVTK
jgi:hypothetical protein